MPNISLGAKDGQVEYRSSDDGEWSEAILGQVIGIGAHLRTLTDSSAIVDFIDGSQIKLMPETELSVEVFQLVEGGPPDGYRISKVKIIEGDIEFEVEDLPSPPNVWQFLTNGEVIAIQ